MVRFVLVFLVASSVAVPATAFGDPASLWSRVKARSEFSALLTLGPKGVARRYREEKRLRGVHRVQYPATAFLTLGTMVLAAGGVTLFGDAHPAATTVAVLSGAVTTWQGSRLQVVANALRRQARAATVKAVQNGTLSGVDKKLDSSQRVIFQNAGWLTPANVDLYGR